MTVTADPQIPRRASGLVTRGCISYRINDDGKISEQWAFEDFAAVLNHVGGVKLPWSW